MTLERVLSSLKNHTLTLGPPLKGGQTNTAYAIRLDGRRGVLRLSQGLRGNRITVATEVQLMKAVGDLAPEVLAWGKGWLITAYVQTSPLNPTSIGEKLARLHQTPAPEILRSLTVSTLLRTLVWDGPIRRLAPIAARVAEQVEGQPHGLCHQDLSAGNVRGEQFIDWEYACLGTLGFDLHTLLRWVPKTQHPTLLGAYHDAGGTAQLSPWMERALQLVDLHWYAERGRVDRQQLHTALQEV